MCWASARMKHTAFIGIGSNLGDRSEYCRHAIELLGGRNDIRIERVSPWYESDAVPVSGSFAEEQPPYVNGVAKIITTLSARELFSAMMDVEASLGRPRPRPKGAPRTIDLDLLLYDDAVIDEPDLKIPHPEIAKRTFVLVPLCDISPDAIHSLSGQSARELLRVCREKDNDAETDPCGNNRLRPLANPAQARGDKTDG